MSDEMSSGEINSANSLTTPKYTLEHPPEDVVLIAFFGRCGYVLFKTEFEPASHLLGFILGELLEENLRPAANYS